MIEYTASERERERERTTKLLKAIWEMFIHENRPVGRSKRKRDGIAQRWRRFIGSGVHTCPLIGNAAKKLGGKRTDVGS